jgi:hypothetical protein
VEHRPHTDAVMEDAPLGSGMAESEDATKIECALRNASIGGCKDALPAFRSTDYNEDEGGGEDQMGDLTPSSLRSLIVLIPTFRTARYASICPGYSISNRFCTFWLIRFVSQDCLFR